MPPTSITQSFTATYWSILLAKLRNFVKRSLPRYTFAGALLTLGLQVVNAQPLLSSSALRNLAIVVLTCMALALMAMLISTPALHRAWRERPITVTFGEDGLLVRVGDNGEPEARGWD